MGLSTPGSFRPKTEPGRYCCSGMPSGGDGVGSGSLG
jgi:hypothetical protein